VILAGGLNVYDVLGHATLILTREAMEQVAARLGDTAAEPAEGRRGSEA
jgi:ribosomal protein L4